MFKFKPKKKSFFIFGGSWGPYVKPILGYSGGGGVAHR